MKWSQATNPYYSVLFHFCYKSEIPKWNIGAFFIVLELHVETDVLPHCICGYMLGAVVSSQWNTVKHRFDVPGIYNFLCSLHFFVSPAKTL